MSYRIPTLVCALYAILVIAVCVQATPALANSACQEDTSCWTWSTMGNHKRAVTVRPFGRLAVVGPCLYQRLRLRGLIDPATKPMRGDYSAIQLGCEGWR